MWEGDFNPDGFSWIDCHDHDHSIIALMRQPSRPPGVQASGDCVIAVVNFTPMPRRGYRLGVPVEGSYAEILNSDADVYGGSNIGNQGSVSADAVPAHGHPYSLALTLPPLGFLLLKPAK